MSNKMEETTAKIANDYVIEILESYMQFVNVMEHTLKKYAKMPQTVEIMSKMLIQREKDAWQPLLDHAKKAKL